MRSEPCLNLVRKGSETGGGAPGGMLRGIAPVGDACATQEALVAGCAEIISRRTGTGTRTEPAPLGGVAPCHSGVARVRVEALIHNACGVPQAPAAGLDWHIGQCDAQGRAIHEQWVACHTGATCCVGLQVVALDAICMSNVCMHVCVDVCTSKSVVDHTHASLHLDAVAIFDRGGASDECCGPCENIIAPVDMHAWINKRSRPPRTDCSPVCMYVCMYVSMYVHTYAHMYVCMYACNYWRAAHWGQDALSPSMLRKRPRSQMHWSTLVEPAVLVVEPSGHAEQMLEVPE